MTANDGIESSVGGMERRETLRIAVPVLLGGRYRLLLFLHFWELRTFVTTAGGHQLVACPLAKGTLAT